MTDHVALPVLPPRPAGAPAATAREPAAAAYRGRGHAVGAIAFGAEAELETVSALASALVRAFCPPHGLRVRASRGARTEILPARFSSTASIRAAQLARGGSVELTAGDFDDPLPRLPLFWVTSDPAAPARDRVPLEIGFSIARPGAERSERAIAHAMSTMIEAAADVEGCLSAIVTAQDAPLTLAAGELPYEALAGTAPRARDATWLRSHVRSPGWQILVPRAAVRLLSRPPDALTLERVASGLLVKIDTATPFACGPRADVERWLLPVLGDER
jgi:hypothetical protein